MFAVRLCNRNDCIFVGDNLFGKINCSKVFILFSLEPNE